MEDHIGTSPVGSAQVEGLSKRRKRHSNSVHQESGNLACKHCPFHTGHIRSLRRHEKHHYANYQFQCNFCTFSSKNEDALIGQHINRVHLDELKTDGVLAQPVIEKREVYEEPTGGELPTENLSLSKAADGELGYTTFNSDDEEAGEEFIDCEPLLDVAYCICGHPQPVYEEGSAVISCDQCDRRFHWNCVHITQELYEQMNEFEEHWICPRCISKEPPISHKTTQPQLGESYSQQQPGEEHTVDRSFSRDLQGVPLNDKEVELIDITMDSDDGEIGVQERKEGGYAVTLMPTRAQTANTDAEKQCPRQQSSSLDEPLDLSRPEFPFDPRIQVETVSLANTHLLRSESPVSPQEEAVCRSELSNLVPEIQAAFEKLLQVEKSFKEAHVMQMARSKSANDLRKKLEELGKKDRSLSIQLVVLKELDESLQQQLKELTAQKTQLELEINALRNVAISRRIKLEFVVSDLSTDVENQIREKRRLFTNARETLAVTMEERAHLAARIRGFEDQKRDSTLNLDKMRAEYVAVKENSAKSTSALRIQLKALAREQRTRIDRFVSLEKKLVQVRFDNDMNNIHREKEKWLDALKNYEEE